MYDTSESGHDKSGHDKNKSPLKQINAKSVTIATPGKPPHLEGLVTTATVLISSNRLQLISSISLGFVSGTKEYVATDPILAGMVDELNELNAELLAIFQRLEEAETNMKASYESEKILPEHIRPSQGAFVYYEDEKLQGFIERSASGEFRQRLYPRDLGNYTGKNRKD